MPWAGGVFTRTDGTRVGTSVWQQAKAALIGILATSHDTHDQDIATGINNCLARDGQNAATGDINAGSHKIISVAACTVASDAANKSYVDTANAATLASAQAYAQPLNSELTALAAASGTGLLARTASGTYAERTITGTANQIAVANGGGVSGAPELSLTGAAAASALSRVSQSVTASSSSLTIDCAAGMTVALTLSASVTSVTLSNWPASGIQGVLTLNITSTGAYTLAGWPGTTYWAGGAAPVVTSGNGSKDTLLVTSVDAGTTYRNFVIAQNMS
jgi:hypothetical protein